MEKENKNQLLWHNFATKNQLSKEQLEQFKKYYYLMQIYNKQHNITAIENIEDIIRDHFDDSLALSCFINSNNNNMISSANYINCIADIGAGAGFPSIPLKIKFKHLKVILIEVVGKKLNFLKSTIEELGLGNVEICNLDWRTFLRNTQYNIDLFCARASLQPSELLRSLKPNCFYNNSTIIYWASQYWAPGKIELDFISNIYNYNLTSNQGHRDRKLIFFQKPKLS